MIAEENRYGDLTLRIGPELVKLIADHLGDADRTAAALFLERLKLRTVCRLERLAIDSPDLARDYLERVAASEASARKPRLKLI